MSFWKDKSGALKRRAKKIRKDYEVLNCQISLNWLKILNFTFWLTMTEVVREIDTNIDEVNNIIKYIFTVIFYL